MRGQEDYGTAFLTIDDIVIAPHEGSGVRKAKGGDVGSPSDRSHEGSGEQRSAPHRLG